MEDQSWGEGLGRTLGGVRKKTWQIQTREVYGDGNSGGWRSTDWEAQRRHSQLAG